MQNGQAKTNGYVSVPTMLHAEAPPKTKAPPPSPPASPFAFVDEFPTKVRGLVDGAVKAAQQDVKKAGDRRYLEGLRRSAFLIGMSMQSLDGPAKQQVMNAFTQLEEECVAAEKALRE